MIQGQGGGSEPGRRWRGIFFREKSENDVRVLTKICMMNGVNEDEKRRKLKEECQREEKASEGKDRLYVDEGAKRLP